MPVLFVNGKRREFAADDFPKNLSALLICQNINEDRCVVAEVNGQAIARANFRTHPLHDGDRIELVRFVGGGFSLIELLMVTAIIAILAGFILVGLQMAMRSARSAFCQSNLRQAGMALMMYADRYSEYIPRGFVRRSDGKYLRWYHCLLQEARDPAIFICPQGHKAPLGGSADIITPPPRITYVWNAMRRDRNYKSDVKESGAGDDPWACGLVRSDNTGMACLLYLRRGQIADDTLVLFDADVGDRSSFIGKGLYEVATSGRSEYNNFDWRDPATREKFTYRLPGVSYCHYGAANALRFDGAVDAVHSTPFSRLTIRKDTE